MWMNIVIYITEIAIMLTVTISGVLFFKLNNKKGLAIFLGIAIPASIIILSLTFIF